MPYRPATCAMVRLERRVPSLPVKKISLRAAVYFSMPTSPPKAQMLSTQPASMAGIRVGWGFSTQLRQILPLSPNCSP